ncbi:HAD family hydrolase [Kiritimatiellaeota bacterium B1221]|nr:HAD family hydrolase [Kiritimatiellaeota bacterium B1221]
MMNKGKTKAALFDLDGTLVDSLQDIANAMNEVLEKRHFPPHPVEAYNTFVGDGMEELIRRVLPRDIEACSRLVEAMVLEMKKAYARHWREHAFAYEGIREMLAGLQAAGIRMGILSNKPDDFVREMVDFVFPEVKFHTVRGVIVGGPVKPSPEGAVEILKGWGLEPAEVLYVGDTNTDMQTGKNTGMFTMGVTWGFRDRRELESSGADAVVDRPAEIVDWLLN